MTTSILALLGISALAAVNIIQTMIMSRMTKESLAAVKRIEDSQYEDIYRMTRALYGQVSKLATKVSELTTDKEEKDAMAETLATCISTLEQSNRHLSVLRNIMSVKQCRRR